MSAHRKDIHEFYAGQVLLFLSISKSEVKNYIWSQNVYICEVASNLYLLFTAV
jgi:hypothetical protein